VKNPEQIALDAVKENIDAVVAAVMRAQNC
jgi:hypothetical protein